MIALNFRVKKIKARAILTQRAYELSKDTPKINNTENCILYSSV